ncbi:MAG: membrane protein insertase YidC [Streptococcaceae bacterium]|nr:membrane protein insertase YidC [Streptococcaceae bacterium]
MNKKLTLLGSLSALLLILSGCVQTHIVNGERVPTDASMHGLYYTILIKPMSAFVDLFANTMHMGYGWGIILVTLIIRLIILPIGLRQAYKMTYMQEKTAYLAPVFEPFNKRLKEAKTQEERMAAQQALMTAQKDNGINMLSSMGCLPMLIQWPFFLALYGAAAYTPGIMSAHFLGINLGKSSIVLTLFAGAFYLLQAWLSTFGMNDQQKQQSRITLFLSPIMIIFFSFASPAGVVLYWVAGGLVMVLQQIIITFIMKPRMRQAIDEEFKKNPPKMADLPKDVTPDEAQKEGLKEISTPVTDETQGRNRNAGKQNRK